MQLKQICHFVLDNRNFGMSIEDVKEICPVSNIRPVHHSHPYFTGLLNLRGNLILIVDLRKVFGFESPIEYKGSKILLLKSHLDGSLGFLVDNVRDIIEVDWDQIEDRRKSKSNEIHSERRNVASLSYGIYKSDQDLTVMVNTAEVLNTLQQKEA